jgi:hypothetical protein
MSSIHSLFVGKTQIRQGLPEHTVVTSLERFWECCLSWKCWDAGSVDVFGCHRCAFVLGLFMWHAFFYGASEVQHLIFSFDFFSEDVDQTVVVLTVVVMLVLPAGARDLVQLGIAVVCVAFLGLSFKIMCGGFILPSFLYKPTCAG